jgi:hypothetical protein
MTAEKIKKCKDCGTEYPETREYFGQYKNKRGEVTKIGYRNSCRKCMAERTAKHSVENPHLVSSVRLVFCIRFLRMVSCDDTSQLFDPPSAH